MTAEEIRNTPTCGNLRPSHELSPTGVIDDCAMFLREIAAQLAELNVNERNVLKMLQDAAAASERQQERDTETATLLNARLKAEIRLIETKEQMFKPEKP